MEILASAVFLLKKMYKAAIHTPLNYSKYHWLNFYTYVITIKFKVFKNNDLFSAMNNWLRSELDCSYYNKQSPINILTELTSTKDDMFVFHILSFFIVILLFAIFRMIIINELSVYFP